MSFDLDENDEHDGKLLVVRLVEFILIFVIGDVVGSFSFVDFSLAGLKQAMPIRKF